jgi:hypothetical protein
MLALTTLEVKKEVGQWILDNKIIVTIGQLLKLTPNLNTYLTSINKQFAHSEGNTFKVIVTIVIATVDHHMGLIIIHVGKNMVNDVLLD